MINNNDLRDEEICRLKQGHGTTMMQVEGKVKSSQEELSRRDNEIQELRVSLYIIVITDSSYMSHLFICSSYTVTFYHL